MKVDDVDLDLNLVSTSDVGRLVALPSWQYRFMDARLISIREEARTAAIAWLNRIRVWVESCVARDRRIAAFRDQVHRLIVRAEEIDGGNPGARAFYYALALERSLFMMCELSAAVPFSELNPLETLAQRVLAN